MYRSLIPDVTEATMARVMRKSGYPLASNLLIILTLAALFHVFYLRLMQPPATGLRIDTMWFTPDAALAQNRAGESLRPLPDDWMKNPVTHSHGRYTSQVALAPVQGDERLAIYIPVIQMHARIHLNGIMLGEALPVSDTRGLADPLAREVYRPFYAGFSSRLVQAGDNRLDIEVSADQAGSGLLGNIYIGTERQLRPYHERRINARIRTVQVISACILTIAIFMTVLWWLRKQDSLYGWFALLVYTWTLHNILFLGYDTPLPAMMEDWLALISLGWFIVFMVICTHRYLEIAPKRTESLMIAIAIMGSVALAVSFAWHLYPVVAHRIWSTLALLLGGYALIRLALEYRHRDDLKNPFVPAGGLSILLLGLHDWLVVTGFVPRDGGLILHFSAPVTLITFATLLLERFTGVLHEAESLNAELETRVARKHQALEANFIKLREMENRQILAEERERFMKEMHDGVGGHLISMLAMIRGGESDTDKITQAIEATLNDLRIMIDSLDPNEHDIPALLGAMRSRLEPQLASSGIQFDWQVCEIPALPDFGPRKALQVMRIVQEAISNIINHADASLIRVHARMETCHDGSQTAVIDIIDNGKGIAPNTRHGRGLYNMMQRAKNIGARLTISAQAPGTRVRLRLNYAASLRKF